MKTATKPAEAAPCWKCTPVKGGTNEYDDLCTRHTALAETDEAQHECRVIAAELAKFAASNASDSAALMRARSAYSELAATIFGIPTPRQIERGQR